MIARSLTNRLHSAFLLLGLFAIVGYLAGCGGQSNVPSLGSLMLTAAENQIPVGLTEQLKVTGLYSDGSSKDLTASVVWTSSSPNLAGVSMKGLVTASAAGSVTVTATVNQTAGAISLTIVPAVLESLAVSAGSPQIPLGATEPLTATGTYSDGSQHDVTSTAAWTSLQPAIASVSSSGLVTAAAVGSASVTATIGAVNAQTQLTVTGAALVSIAVSSSPTSIPLGESQQLTAIGTYTDGTTQNLTNIAAWTSSSPTIAPVSAAGIVTASAVGSAAVTATVSQMKGTFSLTVIPAVLQTLAILAGNSNIPLGSTEQLAATGTYSDGTQQDLTSTAAWTSSPPDITSVSGGMVTGEAIGSSSVMAAVGAVNAQTQLTVTSAALVSIAVKTSRTAIPIGETQQLTAIGTYTDGSTQDLTTTAAWTSSSPKVALIGTAGLAAALASGSTTAEAALNGVTGSKSLTVQPNALTSYFTNGAGVPDTQVRVSNPGFSGSTLCAMFYVFDQDQQMTECCGCTISPDGLRTLSVQKDLTANPLTGVQSTAGSITIVPADYNGAACDASSSTPDGLEVAWATHLYGTDQPQATVSETSFSKLTLGSTLSAALQAQCTFVQQLGSGKGICQCGTGD
jgi:uncharacterized protein YjdB